jgi:tRNA wybutosine-synthesizing protein 1
MLTSKAKSLLEKQQYRIIGTHSAVKVCGWTKKMIKGEGGCYKLKFYGIMSNQCMQMTTSMSCANRCTFCWRGYKAPVQKEWKAEIDDPNMILEESKKQHQKLLNGFGGNPKSNKGAYNSAKTIKHVALSLTGEPITYPRINELIDNYHEDGISTFLVTNAQYPEAIKNLKPITQLYVSIDAPNKELMKEIDVPLFADYWDRFLLSLDYLKEKKQRTCVRLTLIKEMNMCNLEDYSILIKRADPDFIEIKGYMFVGSSRQRLSLKNMPWHEDIVNFSKAILKHIPEYEIVSEHIPSRVLMLAKKKYKFNGKWHTWINFPKFHELYSTGLNFTAEDYNMVTPLTGLSGKSTVKVDEKTDELEFWKE